MIAKVVNGNKTDKQRGSHVELTQRKLNNHMFIGLWHHVRRPKVPRLSLSHKCGVEHPCVLEFEG